MIFNIEKCKIMHFGNKNNSFDNYALGGKILEQVNEENDLGVIINDKFKVGKQCAKVSKKANQVLGLIYRTFTCKSKKIVTQLYKSLVRPPGLLFTRLASPSSERYKYAGKGSKTSDKNGGRISRFGLFQSTKGYEVNNVRNEKIASGFIGSV